MHKFYGFIVHTGTILLSSFTILLSSCSLAANITPPPGSEMQPPPISTQPANASHVFPIVPPDLANGEKIYTQECASCHGTQGLGDGPQAAQLSAPVATLGLSDYARLYTPADWYKVVSEGSANQFMPAFSDLTDRQRWDVVAYAMSLNATADTLSQGEQLYQKNCVLCHGLSGKGDGPGAAGLTTVATDLTSQSLMANSSATDLYQVLSTGISPDMPSYSNTLSEIERWALVSYIRSLTFNTTSQTANTYPGPGENLASSHGSSAYPAPQAYPNPDVTQTLSTTETISSTEPFTGTVSVKLINGSGGDPPSDASVTLYGFDDMQNTYSDTLDISENGVYTFTDVYMPEGRVFLAGSEYASGTYGSDIVSVDPATPDLALQITVYDSTSDISSLSTDRAHIFFDFSDPKNVQVIEVFIISNSAHQAVVAPTADGAVLTFPLPEGYTNLQFQDGELGGRYVEVSQGFADTAAVPPGVGDYQVIFAFQMPYDHKLNFSQPMFLPTSAVVVMVPESGVKVASSQLQDSGARDFQGTTYHMYEGNGLLAGSPLEFTLSGSPKQATAISTGTTQNLAIGLGVFGLVLVGLGVWLYRRNQLKAAAQIADAGMEAVFPGSGENALPEDPDTLIDAIISLDDQYHTGNLPEKAYLERRAILKDKLRQLNEG